MLYFIKTLQKKFWWRTNAPSPVKALTPKKRKFKEISSIHTPIMADKSIYCTVCLDNQELNNNTRKEVPRKRLKCEECDTHLCFGNCWKIFHKDNQFYCLEETMESDEN